MTFTKEDVQEGQRDNCRQGSVYGRYAHHDGLKRGVEKIVAEERQRGNPLRSCTPATPQFTKMSIEKDLAALVAAPPQLLSELDFMQLSVEERSQFDQHCISR